MTLQLLKQAHHPATLGTETEESGAILCRVKRCLQLCMSLLSSRDGWPIGHCNCRDLAASAACRREPSIVEPGINDYSKEFPGSFRMS
jgi:hypothetical protein